MRYEAFSVTSRSQSNKTMHDDQAGKTRYHKIALIQWAILVLSKNMPIFF